MILTSQLIKCVINTYRPCQYSFYVTHVIGRWVFDINLPIGIVVSLLSIKYISSATGRTGSYENKPRLDILLVEIKPVWDMCVKTITTKGIKSRFLTQVCAENISYVRELLKINEVRIVLSLVKLFLHLKFYAIICVYELCLKLDSHCDFSSSMN
jgi:hypothetical protein